MYLGRWTHFRHSRKYSQGFIWDFRSLFGASNIILKMLCIQRKKGISCCYDVYIYFALYLFPLLWRSSRLFQESSASTRARSSAQRAIICTSISSKLGLLSSYSSSGGDTGWLWTHSAEDNDVANDELPGSAEEPSETSEEVMGPALWPEVETNVESFIPCNAVENIDSVSMAIVSSTGGFTQMVGVGGGGASGSRGGVLSGRAGGGGIICIHGVHGTIGGGCWNFGGGSGVDCGVAGGGIGVGGGSGMVAREGVDVMMGETMDTGATAWRRAGVSTADDVCGRSDGGAPADWSPSSWNHPEIKLKNGSKS